jgi:CubicO group peptidase (beta-lactamase class C family)
MALVSRGELSLDTRVSHLLPSFAGSADSTVRDLLLHRAGLWEWQPLYLAPGVTDDVNAVIDNIEPRYEPGSGFHYSDVGFMYLGRIIEAVTGLGLVDAITELVLEPLRLTNTSFRPNASGRPIAAGSYGDRAERGMVATGQPYPVRWTGDDFAWREHELVGEANDGNCFHVFGGVAGHAGLFSTVDDLLDLAQVLAGQRAAPWTTSIAHEFFAAGPDAEQALGFRRAPIELAGESHALLWHPGFTGCAVGFVPDLGLSIVLGSNRLLTRDPAGTPAPTVQLWQPLVQAAALLHSPTTTSSRTS